jgi:hypothetical protein
MNADATIGSQHVCRSPDGEWALNGENGKLQHESKEVGFGVLETLLVERKLSYCESKDKAKFDIFHERYLLRVMLADGSKRIIYLYCDHSWDSSPATACGDPSTDHVTEHILLKPQYTYVLPDASAGAPPRSQMTYWNHNGSTTYLVANGSSREFFYERPRQGMLEAGAVRGALLFSGEMRDNAYGGTAYIFRGSCGQFPYQVSGPILDDGRRVVLRGQAPRINAQCQIVGYLTDTLEFTLIGR